jgi:hypothetical protein
VPDLIRQAHEKLGHGNVEPSPGHVENEVIAFIEVLIIGDALQCRLEPVSVANHDISHPQVNPSLRKLAALRGVPVSLFNQWHQIVRPGPVVELLLPHLDGGHDVTALTEIVHAGAKSGALHFLHEGVAVEDPAQVALAAAEHTRSALQWLAEHAMLDIQDAQDIRASDDES